MSVTWLSHPTRYSRQNYGNFAFLPIVHFFDRLISLTKIIFTYLGRRHLDLGPGSVNYFPFLLRGPCALEGGKLGLHPRLILSWFMYPWLDIYTVLCVLH